MFVFFASYKSDDPFELEVIIYQTLFRNIKMPYNTPLDNVKTYSAIGGERRC